MANNESSRPGSGKLDKIVAAILVFLIFGAGTYGIIREAGKMSATANAGSIEQTEPLNGGNGQESKENKEGAGDKAAGQNGSEASVPVEDQDKDQDQNKDSDQDKDTAKDDGRNASDAVDQGTDADDTALIPKDKTKLSAGDVKKAFNTSKNYKVITYTTAGSGSYIVTADTPIRRFPTTQAEPVGTIKAGGVVRVIAVSDDGAWGQISYGGQIYYVPMKDLKIDPDDRAMATTKYVSGDVSDDNRFVVVVFDPVDPAAGQYVTKADAPSKDAPSYSADDGKVFPAGTTVTVTAVSGNGWTKVTDGGKTYYVNKAYLDPVTSPDDSNDKDTSSGADQSSGDNTDKTDGQDNTDKSGGSGASDKTGNTDKTDKTDKSDKKDSGKTDKSGKSGTSDKSGSSDKSGDGKSDKSGDNKSDKSGDNKSDKSGGSGSDKSGDGKSDKSGDDKKDSDKKSDKYPGTINMTEAKKLLKLINDYRKENGVPELKWSKGLEKASKTRAKEISVTAGSSQPHKRPNGKQWYTVNPDLMYGENIAYGQKTAEEVFKAWKNSSAHNKTMLDPEYKIFAAALYVEEGTKYTYYWIQEFGY